MNENDTNVSSGFGRVWRVYGRTAALASALGAGALLPQASAASFLIPYLIAVMLFFSFLDLAINRRFFGHGVSKILIANLVIAFAGYLLL